MRLIDADALKEAILRYQRYAVDFLLLVDSVPTVEQNWRFYYDHGYKQAERDLKRPQGEWIFTDNRWGLGNWECDSCHEYSNINSNFCPKCGAKMGGIIE